MKSRGPRGGEAAGVARAGPTCGGRRRRRPGPLTAPSGESAQPERTRAPPAPGVCAAGVRGTWAWGPEARPWGGLAGGEGSPVARTRGGWKRSAPFLAGERAGSRRRPPGGRRARGAGRRLGPHAAPRGSRRRGAARGRAGRRGPGRYPDSPAPRTSPRRAETRAAPALPGTRGGRPSSPGARVPLQPCAARGALCLLRPRSR